MARLKFHNGKCQTEFGTYHLSGNNYLLADASGKNIMVGIAPRGRSALQSCEIDYLERRLAVAEADAFRLSAGACCVDGALIGDPWGNPICLLAKQKENAA